VRFASPRNVSARRFVRRPCLGLLLLLLLLVVVAACEHGGLDRGGGGGGGRDVRRRGGAMGARAERERWRRFFSGRLGMAVSSMRMYDS
jgi:hypothetical protein